MKSSYELAMERLNKENSNEQRPLSAEQKECLAEIERVYKGRWAEREILLKQGLSQAQAEGNLETIQAMTREMAKAKASLEEDCEMEKERVRRVRR